MKICAAILVATLAVASGVAVAQNDSEGWQFSLTPYLWLPTIDGTLNYSPPPGGGGAPDIEVGPTEWLDLLNIGALISGTAR